jgi:glycosyltransferase involved in cell wall biosynthesis
MGPESQQVTAPGPADDRAPRLLVVSSDRFEPFRVDVRILFAKELVGRGYRIDWVLQSDTACERDRVVEWGGGTVWVGRTDLGTSRLARLRKHAYAIRNELRLCGLLAQGRHDALVVKDKFIAGIIGLAAARRNSVPFIYWLSYPFPEESLLLAREGRARYPVFYWIRGVVFRFLLYRVILPVADHVLVQSEQMKRDVMAEGIPAARMTPVPMGVDLSLMPSSAAPSRASPEGGRPPTLLYLGTLTRLRRLDILVRILALVRVEFPTARLVLVGDSEDPIDREVLDAEVGRLGLTDAVEFTGFLPIAEAWQQVARADVCLSPFYPTPILNSTSPTKLIEYMALGKPVVANDHPEQRLVIAESDGGLCVPWDETEFARAAILLLRDPPRAAEMGENGRRYVERARTYASIAAMVDRTLRQVIGRRGPLPDGAGNDGPGEPGRRMPSR